MIHFYNSANSVQPRKNKKTAGMLVIAAVIIISGSVFTFQKRNQLYYIAGEAKNSSLETKSSSSSAFSTPKVIDNSPQLAIVGNPNSHQKKNNEKSVSSDSADSSNNAPSNKSEFLEAIVEAGRTLENISHFVSKDSNRAPKIIRVPEDYRSIQLAIDNAKPKDIVKVASGVYRENITMKNGVSVIGAGFPPNSSSAGLNNSSCKQDSEETKLSLPHSFQSNPSIQPNADCKEEDNVENRLSDSFYLKNAEEVQLPQSTTSNGKTGTFTILDGGGFGNVVTFKDGITNKTRLSGFIIRNAGKNLSGVLIENSSPLISNNVITDNEYNIYITGNSSPIIQRNRVHFGSKGIQVYNLLKDKKNQNRPLISDNLITDNKIGIDLYNSSALIDHNTISYNNHYKTYLGPTYGIHLSKSSAEISNNIITDNGVCELCAGVIVDEESKNVTASYNDIWNNKNDFICLGECVIEKSNISEDPLFIDYLNSDFRLKKESALIGKGRENSNIGIRY